MKKIVLILLIITKTLSPNFFTIQKQGDLRNALQENRFIIAYSFSPSYDKNVIQGNHKNIQEVVTDYDEIRNNISAMSINIQNQTINEELEAMEMRQENSLYFIKNGNVVFTRKIINVIPKEALFEDIKRVFNLNIDYNQKTAEREFIYNETNITITNEEREYYDRRPIDYYWPYFTIGAPFWNPYLYYGYGWYGWGMGPSFGFGLSPSYGYGWQQPYAGGSAYRHRHRENRRAARRRAYSRRRPSSTIRSTGRTGSFRSSGRSFSGRRSSGGRGFRGGRGRR